jgi:hypothetical protein
MTGWIVSFSFYPLGAAERDFAIYDNAGVCVEKLKLGTGSVLLMKPGMQHTHMHALLPRPKITTPRINVTLRQHPEPNAQPVAHALPSVAHADPTIAPSAHLVVAQQPAGAQSGVAGSRENEKRPRLRDHDPVALTKLPRRK